MTWLRLSVTALLLTSATRVAYHNHNRTTFSRDGNKLYTLGAEPKELHGLQATDHVYKHRILVFLSDYGAGPDGFLFYLICH